MFSCVSHGLVQFLCFCWSCFFFLVSLVLIILNHSLFLDFSLLIIHLVAFLFKISILIVLVFFLLLLFPPLVFPSLNHLCYYYYCCSFFSPSLCLSRLIALAVVVFCSYSSSFSSFVSSSPIPARTWKGKQWREKAFSFCLPLGDLCEEWSFQNSLFLFFFCGFLLSINMFVWFSWNMFSGSRGLFVASYLMLLCCFGVWKEPSFGPSFLLCLDSLDWLSFLFVLFLFSCLCFFGVLFGSGLFILQFSFSSWDGFFFTALPSCCFFYFISWLLVFLCRFSGCLFMGTGVVWAWAPKGPIFFGLFS